MDELEQLRREMEAQLRALCKGEAPILVHGEGRPGARVMLIGEAPGEQETLQRRPFVGKAGKNLDEFLALAGIERSELYVSNAVKFRPTRRSAAGNLVNRPPTREEVAFFLPWLQREIALVAPGVVVTLGNVPLRALLGPKVGVGELHGRFRQSGEFFLYPMYHPASLIYNPSLRSAYAEDVRRLAQWLQAADAPHPAGS